MKILTEKLNSVELSDSNKSFLLRNKIHEFALKGFVKSISEIK